MTPTKTRSIRLPPAEEIAWSEAARAAQLDLNSWVRMVCNDAANAGKKVAAAPQNQVEHYSTDRIQRREAVTEH